MLAAQAAGRDGRARSIESLLRELQRMVDRLPPHAGRLGRQELLIADEGAAGALRHGKSLLPAGVIGVEGVFERGDAGIIRTRTGVETGRGLSAYSSADIQRIAGYKSGEIAGILGYRGRDEIIHRDDLVVTESR